MDEKMSQLNVRDKHNEKIPLTFALKKCNSKEKVPL